MRQPQNNRTLANDSMKKNISAYFTLLSVVLSRQFGSSSHPPESPVQTVARCISIHLQQEKELSLFY